MYRTIRKRWPLVAALVVAAFALVWAYRPGAILGYFRDQASALEVFTLVLFLIFLMPPLFERLRLPAAVGLVLWFPSSTWEPSPGSSASRVQARKAKPCDRVPKRGQFCQNA